MAQNGAPSTAMSKLLIAEYQERLQRYRQLAEQQNQLQQWALVFSGALWAWVLSRQRSLELVAASWIPVIMNIFFYSKARLLDRIAGTIYVRLDQIASAVGHSESPYVTEWVSEKWEPWSTLFWTVVIVLTIVIASVYTALFLGVIAPFPNLVSLDVCLIKRLSLKT